MPDGLRLSRPSVDGDHLQQALMNLLLNAIDASGTNGAVASVDEPFG